MKIGLIGLGKMGSALGYRLHKAGYTVVGFDPIEKLRREAQADGIEVVEDLKELTSKVRVFWIMVPAGEPVDMVIATLKPGLCAGDSIIDGGNSHFTDSMRRSRELRKLGISFLDCGVSGGLKGKEIGFSLMIGGTKESYERLEPLFASIAHDKGYGYFGPAGAGHYVKMVHNGIEYAVLQAFGEGFHLLREGRYKDLDLAKVADVWAHGSVIRSWIVELCADVFSEDQSLRTVSGAVGENMTGQWMQAEASELKIPTMLLDDALAIRAWSRSEKGGNFATKLIAMLRYAFGGHLYDGKKNK
jgi:6-phosphogluconate dehydrogenase